MPASKKPPTPAKPAATKPVAAKPAAAEPKTAAPASAKPAAATRSAHPTGATKPAAATHAAEKSALLSRPGAAAKPAPAAPPQSDTKTAKKRRLKLPPANRRIGNEDEFWAAIGISIFIHLGLGFGFGLLFLMPNFKPTRLHDKGLDVVLVNAKHAHAPDDPLALAQANLSGGGNSDEKARAKTPTPPQEQNVEGDALLEQRQRVEQLEEQNRQLLTQNKKLSTTQVDTPPPEENAPTPTQPKGSDLYNSARAAIKLEAEIDREHREYAARPRKAFIGARTREVFYAQYVEAWREKVQRVGELNFPHDTRGKLYGSLLMTLEIRPDGSLEKSEVTRSSGNPALDAAALRIVSLAAPYPRLTPEILKHTDILVITRTWTFTREDTLDASK